MNTNTNISDQLKTDIDKTDHLTAKSILNLLEMRDNSVWFNNEMPPEPNKETYFTQPEENLLTFEEIKQLYPHWFES